MLQVSDLIWSLYHTERMIGEQNKYISFDIKYRVHCKHTSVMFQLLSACIMAIGVIEPIDSQSVSFISSYFPTVWNPWMVCLQCVYLIPGVLGQ